MKTEIHLCFDGNCKEALEFYAKLFDGKIEGMLSYGESPMAEHLGAEHHNKIVHATLDVGQMVIAGADLLENYQEPAGIYLLLQFEDLARAEEIFSRLAVGGKVVMALQKTFWSPAFGIVTDRFSIPWEINCAGEN